MRRGHDRSERDKQFGERGSDHSSLARIRSERHAMDGRRPDGVPVPIVEV